VYTLFVPPSPQATPTPPSCSVLFSDFVEEKTQEIIRKKQCFASLGYKGIPSIASTHLYIVTYIGSCLPDLFTTPCSSSHSGLWYFKITLFPLQHGTHQPHSSFRFPFLSLFLLCMFSP
jgi:hypothetical protein